jgi:hypothetical protein
MVTVPLAIRWLCCGYTLQRRRGQIGQGTRSSAQFCQSLLKQLARVRSACLGVKLKLLGSVLTERNQGIMFAIGCDPPIGEKILKL